MAGKKDLRNISMKLEIKHFTLENNNDLTADYIEQNIKEQGYTPLRWAIVETNQKNILLDTVVIKN